MPVIPNLTGILCAIVATLLLCAGSAYEGAQYGIDTTDAKWIKKQQDNQIQKDKEEKQLAKLAELTTASFNKKQAEIQDLRARLQNEIGKNTDGRICFDSWGAVGLWNAAISGAGSVPGRAAVSSVPAKGAGVTDADILRNQVENGTRWQECRAQLKSIIDWRNKTRGAQ